MLQARLGIMRKTLDKLQDKKLACRSAGRNGSYPLWKWIAARQQVGTYAMMYLRSIFPENDSPLWSRLESSIAENQSSGTLWGTLETQMSERKATEGSQVS